jgi:hypothetical protein
MIAGISVFLLWLPFRWEVLEAAGAYVILIGVILVPFGFAFLNQSTSITADSEYRSRPRGRLKVVLAVCLLFINFPLAFGIIIAVDNIKTRYYVTVVNESNHSMEKAVISGGGVSVELGTIFPGEKITRYFLIKGEGTLVCEYAYDGVRRKSVIDGYVCSGMGGDVLVHLRRDGDFAVDDVFGRQILEKIGELPQKD